MCVGPSHTLAIIAFSPEECEKAFEILFEIIREDILSINKDCSVQSDQFQSLISKLQRGSLVQIEVLPDAEENLVRIIGIEEDISRATQEIFNFIKEVVVQCDTYKPQVSQCAWNFLAGRVNHESVKQISKDLEQYNVSIEITDDHEQFIVCGLSDGIEQCKNHLSDLASKIAEQEKHLKYAGIKRLFLDQTGKEQLKLIEKEMDVEIEIVRSDRRFSKVPVPLPRTFSLPTVKAESFIYDMCNFTTKEGINVCWKYGSIENEVVSNVLELCGTRNPKLLSATIYNSPGINFLHMHPKPERLPSDRQDSPCYYKSHLNIVFV